MLTNSNNCKCCYLLQEEKGTEMLLRDVKGELGEEQIIGLYVSSWTLLNICHIQGSPRAPHKEKFKLQLVNSTSSELWPPPF